jgi:hypothetical protein
MASAARFQRLLRYSAMIPPERISFAYSRHGVATIDIIPPYATLASDPDSPSNETRILKFINTLVEAVTVSDPKSSNPLFNTELKTVPRRKRIRAPCLNHLAPGSHERLFSHHAKDSSKKVPVINATAFVSFTLLCADTAGKSPSSRASCRSSSVRRPNSQYRCEPAETIRT